MSGGQLRRSGRSSYSVSYHWPWETLSYHHNPDACSHAVSLSLSGSVSQHIIPNMHADLPYKAACLETIIFMCCCVKSQDHKITRLQHNHFQALGRLRPVEHFLFRAGKNSTNLLLSGFLCSPSHRSGKH